jgi:hypothetical protein
MNDKNEKQPRGRFLKIFIVLTGIVFGQLMLYGPSLTGSKLLLPVDLLAKPATYIPQNAGTAKIKPHDDIFADWIDQFEPARQFAVSEIHQGRFPLWSPYQYGGVPFIWAKFSPFLLLEYTVKSPVILAWAQLFEALVAGAGMYFLCRQLLRVSFWPAAICAWCYPLTAFFVLWQGSPVSLPVCWMPWLFWFTDKTIRGTDYKAVIGLSIATGLVLISGNIDVAGQVLLGAGIYALWCLWDSHPGEWLGGKSRNAVVKLVLGWGLGFLLAAPHMLPLLEYAHTGSRMAHRSAGAEERPPMGLAGLPQVVLPDIYGSTQSGSCFISPEVSTNLMESPSAAYAGVFAALFVAPLAWCDRRRRAANFFWTFFAFFGLSWCLNVPGFVQLLRLPGLNMMSHNRLVFFTSFAILSLTAIGLENLLTGAVLRRWWFWPQAMLLAGLCGWCFYRSVVLPEPVATQIEHSVFHGEAFGTIRDIKGVYEAQAWFIRHYTVAALFCGLGFTGWLALWFQKFRTFRWWPLLPILLLADLLWFGHDRSAQCDPALYYPKIPALDTIEHSVPGRIIGVHSLPPSVAAGEGLNDIRGYDPIDPARMVTLLKNTAEPGEEPIYTAIQFLLPSGKISAPGSIRLSPILDMLDVRYVIFQGTPPPDIHPAFQSPDYWVLINSNALPRVFVPKSLETASNDADELKKMTAPEFNPLDVAYVESPVKLPAPGRGVAQITHEIPTRVTISVRMETPGLVVLADRWDKGWRAYYNEKPELILRTDYAIRGVIVPTGNGTLEFVYKPASLLLGLWLAGIAAIVLLCWPIIVRIRNRGVKKNGGGGDRPNPLV